MVAQNAQTRNHDPNISKTISDMPKKVPPLMSLRAFVMAGRYESFKIAAEALNISPGAISQHVKNLEDALGTKLFERSNRMVRLTTKGADYLQRVQVAFDIINVATKAVTDDASKGLIVVSTMPSFAAQWLVPRLGRFQERNPTIDVHVDTTTRLVRFDRDRVDVAIRHGLGNYDGLYSERLFAIEMVMVCSPGLLGGRGRIKGFDDLTRFQLLHEEERTDWSLWLRANGATDIDSSRGPSFSDETSLVQAAIAGQGIALVRDILVETHIADGRLIKPMNVDWPTQFAYYCVCPEGARSNTKIAAFRTWLFDEVHGMKR
ncbi:transcriptional regulator GcvA [Rhizobium sp. FY34]|uniref:transcriptional regulator GcvA n=1 Tax=Rhizobium sp. FY34 TaxID=2562309 RepID=UPI0010C02257|nr:transcriptional regulator GcvA [Rhizobium sp. FY34]